MVNPNKLPAENFNLKPFTLQLPLKPTSGSIEEITPKELSDYESELFFTDKTDGSLVFKCPTKGYTTKNSKYCRTELREENEFDFIAGNPPIDCKSKDNKACEG